jgi:hypothetical protein
MTAVEVLAVLAHCERLRIFGAIAAAGEAGIRLDDAARVADIDFNAASKHFRKLWNAQLVERREDVVIACPRAIVEALREIGSERAVDHNPEAPPEINRLLGRGGISEIPRNAALRQSLLAHIAEAFDPMVTYSESQVNETLHRWHPDHAALRRYLVEAGMLDRDSRGSYWRHTK